MQYSDDIDIMLDGEVLDYQGQSYYILVKNVFRIMENASYFFQNSRNGLNFQILQVLEARFISGSQKCGLRNLQKADLAEDVCGEWLPEVRSFQAQRIQQSIRF